MVIWDDEGTVTLSTSQRIPSFGDAMEAEASAVLAGSKVLGDLYRADDAGTIKRITLS